MSTLLIGGSKGLGLAIYNKLTAGDSGEGVLALSRSSDIKLNLEWPEEEIISTVKYAIKQLDGIDNLIISSGAGAYLNPTVGQQEIQKLFNVNVFGPMIVFRAAQKALLKSKGKAIMVSSTVARRPSSGGLSYYASTKGALNSWVMAEGRRQAKHGVALCAVAPGWFESEMTAEIKPEIKAASERAIPFKRFGTAEEVADYTCSLLTQSNWCLAGQVFEISGAA